MTRNNPTTETTETPAAHVLECVLFEVATGVDRDEFVAAADAMTAWARTQRGFLGRELYEVGDGRWIDTVSWATMDDAHAAAAAIGDAPAAAGFVSKIDGPTVQMLHGTPVLDRT